MHSINTNKALEEPENVILLLKKSKKREKQDKLVEKQNNDATVCFRDKQMKLKVEKAEI